MLLSITCAEGSYKNSPFLMQGDTFCSYVKHIAEAGAQGMELQLPDPEQFDEGLLEICKRYQIQITSLATGLSVDEGLSLSADNTEIRRQTIERMHRYIDLASRINKNTIVLIGLLIGRCAQASSREVYLENLSSSLRDIVRYAQEKQIVICIEPINHYDSDILNTWKDMADFLDHSGCSAIKLAMDLYHMRMEEKDILDTIRRFSNRIGSVQMMDDNRLAPGFGCLRFEAIVETVLAAGYDGPITIECLPRPDRETALKQSVQFYQKYFSGKERRTIE